jgi:hypothetical protein
VRYRKTHKPRREAKREETEVTLRFTATGATKFVPGPYQGVLVMIERKYKQVEKDGTKEERPYHRWIFEVLTEGYEGMTLSALTSTSFGVGPAGPAKGRRYAEVILGRELHTGEQFTPEDLYNKPVTLHIDNETTGRGTFARIIQIAPASGADEAA